MLVSGPRFPGQGCFVFLFQRWSVWGNHRGCLGKQSLIFILRGPRDRRPGMLCRATWERHQGDRRQKAAWGREPWGPSSYWGSQGTGKVGVGEPPQTDWDESFQQVWAGGEGSACRWLVPGPGMTKAEECCLLECKATQRRGGRLVSLHI